MDKKIRYLIELILIFSMVFLVIYFIVVLSEPDLNQNSTSINLYNASPKSFVYLIRDGVLSNENAKLIAENTELIIINEYDSEYISTLRSFNKDIKIFIYKHSGINKNFKDHTCGDYDYVIREHEDWILRDNKGNYLVDDFSSWTKTNIVVTNFNNKEFREYITDECVNEISGLDVDGIYIDWLPVEPDWYFNDISEEVKEEIKKGLFEYTQLLKTKLNLKNKQLIVNSAGFEDSKTYDTFLPRIDGYLEEFFISDDSGHHSPQIIASQVNHMDNNKLNLMQARVYDQASFNYAYSLFLMNYDETSYFNSIQRINDISTFKQFLYYHGEYPHIGRPVKTYEYHYPVFKREFENAIVWVDIKSRTSGLEFKSRG